jgi:hypothetical protein
MGHIDPDEKHRGRFRRSLAQVVDIAVAISSKAAIRLTTPLRIAGEYALKIPE